jgi:hypothetical protein
LFSSKTRNVGVVAVRPEWSPSWLVLGVFGQRPEFWAWRPEVAQAGRLEPFRGNQAGDGYKAKNLPIAKERLYRAGARLAMVLNESFPAD